MWDAPDGGLHQYLVTFLSSPDSTFQHIAVWTIAQLLDSGDEVLMAHFRSSTALLPPIQALSTAAPASGGSTPSSSVGTHHNAGSVADSTLDGGTSAEIAHLSLRIVQVLSDPNGRALLPGELLGGQHSAAPSTTGAHDRNQDESGDESGGEGSGEEQLRQSVREALGGAQNGSRQ